MYGQHELNRQREIAASIAKERATGGPTASSGTMAEAWERAASTAAKRQKKPVQGALAKAFG